MGNMDIEQRVISVFWNKFQFHAERLSETQKADSLLNPCLLYTSPSPRD